MKIKYLFNTCLAILLTTATIGQTFQSVGGFYIFKTEDDFYKGIKSYRGTVIDLSGSVVKYLDEAKQKKKINMVDSNYFGYHADFVKAIIINKNPQTFLGGNKNAYVTSTNIGNVSYDNEGYMTNYTFMGSVTDHVYLFFVNKKEKVLETNIEKFLKGDLLAKYKAEKVATDKRVWNRNYILIWMKYFKEYCKLNE